MGNTASTIAGQEEARTRMMVIFICVILGCATLALLVGFVYSAMADGHQRRELAAQQEARKLEQTRRRIQQVEALTMQIMAENQRNGEKPLQYHPTSPYNV